MNEFFAKILGWLWIGLVLISGIVGVIVDTIKDIIGNKQQ
jgi:hypothetical protein